MKPQAFIVIAIVVVAGVVGFVKWSEHEKKQQTIGDVKSCYAALMAAYKSSNGEASAALLTDKSFEHYRAILQLGLNAPESQTRSLQPHQLVEVFKMRSVSTRKELAKLDGRGFVVHAVNKGWWADQLELDFKTVELAKGWAEIVLHDQEWADAFREQRIGNLLSGRRRRWTAATNSKIPPPVELRVRAMQEPGGWKICEASSAPSVDKFYRDIAALEGLDATKLIVMSQDLQEDGKPDPKLWKPMK